MKAIDTNVLVRLLVDDAKATQQCEIARSLAIKEKCVFISQIVQVETVWVLESCYVLTKPEIGHMLQHLAQNAAFRLQHETEFEHALNLYLISNVGFSDCLILASAVCEKYALVTFDKKLGKLSGTLLLKS